MQNEKKFKEGLHACVSWKLICIHAEFIDTNLFWAVEYPAPRSAFY